LGCLFNIKKEWIDGLNGREILNIFFKMNNLSVWGKICYDIY
jgi:hypothetical protein